MRGGVTLERCDPLVGQHPPPRHIVFRKAKALQGARISSNSRLGPRGCLSEFVNATTGAGSQRPGRGIATHRISLRQVLRIGGMHPIEGDGQHNVRQAGGQEPQHEPHPRVLVTTFRHRRRHPTQGKSDP